jgi:hypothetical protein
MATVTATDLPMSFLQLRVLLWKDDNGYVGQCLETGSVATADDYHELRNMMFVLLSKEYEFNIHGEGSIRNFFDTPAPREVWERFYDLSKNRNTDYVSGILMLDATF